MLHKSMNSFLLIFSLVFIMSQIGVAQKHFGDDLRFEVHRVYPSVSVTKQQLYEAMTLDNINKYFTSDWIKEYVSVEVKTIHNGKSIKSIGKSNSITSEQKEQMKTADAGSNISVNIQYIPDNTLKHNDVKQYAFTFVVNPDHDATYAKGEAQLRSYLWENAIKKITARGFIKSNLAAIKFGINSLGQIIGAQIAQATEDAVADEILLQTVCNMPNWLPAKYANGTTVHQEFVLTVGNMESCNMNLLNIKREVN